MTDVLLLYPPYVSGDKAPPLGLGYLGSFLEKHGYSVKILDMDPSGITTADLPGLVRKHAPQLVGISFMTNQYKKALEVARSVKEVSPSIPIVVGGNHVSALPAELLAQECVDYAVVMEGEYTLLELAQCLSRGGTGLHDIKGLVHKEGATILRNPNRELVADLDSLPFPKWDDFPIHAYADRIVGVREEQPVFSLLTSRGCPAKCSFCSSHTVFTRMFRKRSAENIFGELETLEGKFGAKHFNFVDDTLTIDKSRVHRLCDLLIENRKPYKWLANARVNTVDEDLLRKMSDAGCRNICFGVESGDPAVRQKIGKAITDEQIRDAHRWAKKSGIMTTSFFMVGNLGETWESIGKTISLAMELGSDNPTCSIATPFPDTQFMDEAEKNGWLLTKDWEKYITTPHLDQSYSPVATNGILSGPEMLEAYYRVNAAFARAKMATKYGTYYLVNPQFYREEVVARLRKRGVWQTFKLSGRLAGAWIRGDKRTSRIPVRGDG